MKSNKTFFAVSAIALASTFSLAHAATFSLAPAGQGPIDEPVRASTVSRDAARFDVAQARTSGQLVPAGQGIVAPRPTAASELTRAEVKSETLEARRAGDLIPAGEGEYGAVVARHGVADDGYPVASAARRNRASRTN